MNKRKRKLMFAKRYYRIQAARIAYQELSDKIAARSLHSCHIIDRRGGDRYHYDLEQSLLKDIQFLDNYGPRSIDGADAEERLTAIANDYLNVDGAFHITHSESASMFDLKTGLFEDLGSSHLTIH